MKLWVNRFLNHFDKYRRYYAAALIGLCMVGMLGKGIPSMAENSDPMTNVYVSYSDESENDELTDLLTDYYKAYDSADTDALEKIATPVSDSEKSYMTMLSDYVDHHDIVELYSKKGATDGSLLVSAYVNIYFTGQKTAAPGLDFFYVETNSKGKLYINNLYSSYNLNNSEQEVDPTITSMIAAFEQQDDVLALQQKVQEKYNEALLNDSDLKTFTESTLAGAISKWATDYKTFMAAVAQQQQEEEQAAAEAAAAEAAAEEQAANEEANKYTVYTLSQVNVRSAADENSNLLGQIPINTAVTKYADEGDWSKIDYQGTKAYIKTEFLTTDQAQAQAKADEAANSTVVTLSTTVNVRSSMDENASKVAVAYMGSQITVLGDQGNGWSKVNYNGQEGYAKTEYLK